METVCKLSFDGFGVLKQSGGNRLRQKKGGMAFIGFLRGKAVLYTWLQKKFAAQSCANECLVIGRFTRR